MKATIRELEALKSAILEISAWQEENFKTSQRPATEFNPKFYYALARNLELLTSALATSIKKQGELVKRHSQDGKIDLNLCLEKLPQDASDELKAKMQQSIQSRLAFLKEWESIRDVEEEVNLRMVPLEFVHTSIPIRMTNGIKSMLVMDEPAAMP